MGELLDQGLDVAVVKDATAGAITPELGDRYESALTTFGFLANHLVTTEVVAHLNNERRTR